VLGGFEERAVREKHDRESLSIQTAMEVEHSRERVDIEVNPAMAHRIPGE
jgi:hypothetical protein